MTRTLQEIMEALDPAAVRQSLQEAKGRVEKIITDAAVELQIEQANPTLSAAIRAQVVDNLTQKILGMEKLREDIEERLTKGDAADADKLKALLKPNRAARRKAKVTNLERKAVG